MNGKRFTGTVAAITIPLALAVQAVLAAGDTPPGAATPEGPEHRTEIDPGFIVRAGADIDPGFILEFEDRSNDTGFLAIPGGRIPAPAPSPAPAAGTPPALALDPP